MSGRRSSDGGINADEHQHFLGEEGEDEEDGEVGEDQEEGEDNKLWSKNRVEEQESASQSILPHSSARLSVANLHETVEEDGEEPMHQQKKGGLSARTGAILVRHFLSCVQLY
jgi:hypothetical protein